MAASVAVVIGLASCLTPEQTSALTALNNDRKANHKATLGTVNDSQVKAQAWANKIAADNKLSHSVLSAGIHVKYCALAENVGVGSSIAAVEHSFMSDTVHRNNVLGDYNGVGVGVAHNGSNVYVVQDFIRTC